MIMKRMRSTAIAVGAVVAVTALSACASGASNSDIRLAGIVANSTDPFWTTVICGATKEAKAQGVEMDWYTSATTSAESIAQNFDSAMLTEPSGVYLNPFQGTQFATQVADLMASGVPVVTPFPLDPASQFDVTPVDTAGENFSEQFVEILTPGAGKIVALGGMTGIQVIVDQYQPMLDAAAKARPDITVLPTEFTDFDVTKATNIVSALLLAHPDLKMIIASTGPEAEGAAAAVKQAGLSGKVQIWAFDATPAEVEALKDGTITIIAAKPAQLMGATAVQILIDAIKNNPDKKPLTSVNAQASLPVTIITKDTLETPEAQAAIYQTTCSE